jgi:hypothetical protein
LLPLYYKHPEDGGHMFIQHIGLFLTEYTALYARRQDFLKGEALLTSSNYYSGIRIKIVRETAGLRQDSP